MKLKNNTACGLSETVTLVLMFHTCCVLPYKIYNNKEYNTIRL